MSARSSATYDPVPDLARRGAARLAVGGGLALSAASLIQIVTGDPSGIITFGASVPTTVAAIVTLRRRRVDVVGLLVAISVMALIAEIYAALIDNTEYVAGIGGEVVVFGLGLLAVFVAKNHRRRIAAGFLVASALIVATGQLSLNGWTLEIVSDLVVMLAVLGTVMYLVIRVMETLTVSQSRYSELAGVIPVATFEFDIARVMSRLRTMSATPGKPLSDAGYVELMGLLELSYTNQAGADLASVFGAWRDFVAGPNLHRVQVMATSVLYDIRAGNEGGFGEVSFVSVDGQEQDFIYRWVLGTMAGRSNPDRLVLALTDVTQLRQTERELEKQLRDRDQFVASVSHELRTPLTAIMGLTEELVARPEDFRDAEQAELLAIVASETRDVVDIVEDLLVTARAEAGQLTVSLEPCDLGVEAQKMAELLGGIPISVDPVWTNADSGRLRQVLRNLISNAHRYGGDYVRVRVTRDGDWAVAEVRDTGDPLPPEEQDRIFEAYEKSGDGSVVGSVGLGLHVARLLSRLMGGDLRYSHDGTEAIFRLQLPVAPVSDV